MDTNKDKKKYSILTYNIGKYELMKEVKYKSPNAEYIYVTDDRSLTSSTWQMVYVDNPYPEDPFYLCYDIRFNPFKYVNTDIVLRIDGSMQVIGNTDELIDIFNAGGYDSCNVIHPVRNTIYDEMVVWCQCRGYSVEQANRVLSFMANYEGYDVKGYKCLFQYNFQIQRNNKVNNDLNSMIHSLLRYLAEDKHQVERVDQTVASFVINKYFQNRIKILPVDQRIAFSKYFSWFAHKSDYKFPHCGELIEPYMFNEPIDTNTIDYFG